MPPCKSRAWLTEEGSGLLLLLLTPWLLPQFCTLRWDRYVPVFPCAKGQGERSFTIRVCWRQARHRKALLMLSDGSYTWTWGHLVDRTSVGAPAATWTGVNPRAPLWAQPAAGSERPRLRPSPSMRTCSQIQQLRVPDARCHGWLRRLQKARNRPLLAPGTGQAGERARPGSVSTRCLFGGEIHRHWSWPPWQYCLQGAGSVANSTEPNFLSTHTCKC